MTKLPSENTETINTQSAQITKKDSKCIKKLPTGEPQN